MFFDIADGFQLNRAYSILNGYADRAIIISINAHLRKLILLQFQHLTYHKLQRLIDKTDGNVLFADVHDETSDLNTTGVVFDYKLNCVQCRRVNNQQYLQDAN